MQEFVNTVDHRRGQDVLASPTGLARWLEAHDLLGHGQTVDGADLATALRLREVLRDVFDPRRGLDGAAAGALNDVTASAGIAPHVTAGGLVRLRPAADGTTGALGRIAATSLRALLDGSAAKLKTCAAPECRWLFFDGSRNRSSAWCEDALCGSRHRMRALRARRR